MVKAELSYNPYLLETSIKFNGRKPRINSLVEKYHQNVLQSWVSRIPSIFYDEMNGYDFELDFSGTKSDCEDVKTAFLDAGVDETQVRIFHKNELDCRYVKIQQIENLLEWFGKNKNRKFDYALFMAENEEFFQNCYDCVVLNGSVDADTLFEEYHITIEIINDVSELDNTKLLHTPILMCISVDTMNNLKQNLQYFFQRRDVDEEQLFFLIQTPLNADNVERTIKDLGVGSPKIITSVKDELVKKYLEVYPVTDYICQVIKILQQTEKKIELQLMQENEQSTITNRAIHERIDKLENIIKRLKTSEFRFANRDNFEMSMEMWNAKLQLIADIQNWKNKKTKITKENDAVNASNEFNNTLKHLYQNFIYRISGAANDAQNAIEAEYEEWYLQAEFDTDYYPGLLKIEHPESKPLPEFSNELLQLKEERYVTPKEDILGLFFKSSADKSVELVKETTFYYQKWRDYAAGVIEPIANELINAYEIILKSYSSALAEKYQEHLNELIQSQTEMKEEVAAQLSDDELKLQIDNDWFAEFQDQLRNIERG